LVASYSLSQTAIDINVSSNGELHIIPADGLDRRNRSIFNFTVIASDGIHETQAG